MKLSIIVLGRNKVKLEKGFSGGEDGDWTLYKCFYDGENGEYGEFYFNVNEKKAIAEIVLKSTDYSSDLVSAFGATMRGEKE